MTLAQYLKNKRQAQKLTQREVGNALGFGSAHQFVSNWERGACLPPLKKMKKLISLYKIDREEMIEMILRDYEKQLRGVM